MSRYIEFHIIQTFAPSNLNRDDTGAPKDAIFGGFRRARISSQCLKRSARYFFNTSESLSEKDILNKENLSIRTRYLDDVLKDTLDAIGLGEDAYKLNKIVEHLIKFKPNKDKEPKKEKKPTLQLKWKAEADMRLSYLHFFSSNEIAELKQILETPNFQDVIKELAAGKGIKDDDLLPLAEAVRGALQNFDKAVDIALFGRMLANLPKSNQDAACQVAHAISTHKVDTEFDFFTAIDDMQDKSEPGSGHMDSTMFNSATFYRYAVVDINKLYHNLSKDRDLTLSTIEAFTQALFCAIPTGKQNSFAAHNPPTFIGACLRHLSPLNLANAFEKPVRPYDGKSITDLSVIKLGQYASKLDKVYGSPDDQWQYLDLTDEKHWTKARSQGTEEEKLQAPKTINDLVDSVKTLTSQALDELEAKA